ncbi:hypothetical protein A2Z61_01235 [Candidatus Campbellbacteria bacterium RIFCSPLOWO2_02_35_12]|uniref:Uncharacterized protein n=1 Tax=Candidatus Campbellbacteria bacterium RIFCSPLOWO2_02_35_12 TaxID=1797580 RepID=A0A1F5EFU5_9BACT|nr:MAG: hypothetical protein A2Z61_01235 [Candidatus Campbellbacteria bacterium RIFCSPLOWO2_02_35_12]
MKKKLEEIVGKKIIVKNGNRTVTLVAEEVVDVKKVFYFIKEENVKKGLLCVINGNALAIDNRYSDDKYLDELISSSSSKEISVFVYETTEISLFPYKKEKIEILYDSL